jgi:hypothetical protein
VTLVRLLYDGEISVAYHLFWIRGADDISAADGRGGQRNGLCGAAEPGMLVFTAGPHTGELPIRVERHDAEPDAAGAEWGEVVEVSYRPGDEPVVLALWEGDTIPLEVDGGDWRVRYCCRDFDDEDAGRALVQLWPGPPGPDAIVRQTASAAAYWHKVAQETPAPPSAADRAAAARREREERDRRAAEWRRKDQERYWGGPVPGSARLLAIAPSVVGLARLDRDLVDAVEAAADPRLRAMAAWSARRACELAGLDGADWVAAGLDALDGGDPPPPWFADFHAAFARWRDVPRESITHRATLSFGPPREPVAIDPAVVAIGAVVAARGADPLDAAFTALRHATEAGPDRIAETLAAFRAAFDLGGRSR